MRRCIEIIALIFWVGCHSFAIANGAEASVVSGDFEGVGTPGVFSLRDAREGIALEYYSPTQRRTLSYFVRKFDECSGM